MFNPFQSEDPPGIAKRVLNETRDKQLELGDKYAGLGDEFGQFRKDMFDYTTTLMNNVIAQQMEGFNQQMAGSKELMGMARASQQFYDQVYTPLREQFAQTAAEYATPERRAAEAARAKGEVAKSFDAQRRNIQANLQSYGVDPSELRNQALDRDIRLEQAAAQAQAGTAARRYVDDKALQLQQAAIGQGDAVLNRDLNMMAMADQFARSGGAMGGNALNAAQGIYGLNAGAYGQQGNLYGGAANTYSSGVNTELGKFGARMQQHGATIDPLTTLWGLGATAAGGGFGGGGLFGANDGGVVPPPEAVGGAVPPSQRPNPQDVTPSALTPGEFVIPEETVRWKGEEFFHKQVAKAKEDAAAARGQPAGAIPTGGQAA